MEIKDYEKLVKDTLSEKRALHSFGVAKLARSLAVAYKLDPDKAYIAGLLHDITKELDDNTQNEILIKNNDLDKLNAPIKVKHSYTSKYYLKDKLNINDDDILDACYNHTICNSNNIYAKIVYIADKRDETRPFKDNISEIAHSDIDKAYQMLLEWNRNYLEKKNK